MCQACGVVITAEFQNTTRIVEDSERLIETSKNLNTKLKRCDLVIQKAQELSRYEQYGISLLNPPASYWAEHYRQKRDQIVVESVQELSENSIDKAAQAASPKAAAVELQKAAGKVKDAEKEIQDADNLRLIEQTTEGLLTRAREEQLKQYLEAAEKSEFLGQKKKALTQYQEALYFLHKESKEGRSIDQAVFQSISNKVQELSEATV